MIGLGARRRVGLGAIDLVTITPGSALELAVDDTQPLAAHAYNAVGQELDQVQRTVSWSSSNASVATVSSAGLVTAIGEGTCTITARIDGIASAALDVEVAEEAPSEEAQAPLFFSDFTNSLGRGANAISDGGKWATVNGRDADSGTIVVASTGLTGFPANANVLACEINDSNNVCILGTTPNTFDEPEIGESQFVRFYYQCRQAYDAVNTGNNAKHPIQDGGAGTGGRSLEFRQIIRSNGTHWGAGILVIADNGENSFANQLWLASPDLEIDEVYRFEFEIRRTGANDYTLHGRVYQHSNVVDAVNGVLIRADADFTNEEHGGSLTLEDEPTLHPRNGAGFATLRYLTAGHNGISGQTNGWPLSRQTGFAVARDRWIGKYGAAQITGEAA